MIIIKSRRKKHWIIFSIIALILLSFLFEYKRADLFIKDPLYEVMESDPGFSSVKNILLSFESLSFTGKIAKITQTLSQNIQGFPQRPKIERLDIDIAFLEQQKILNDRDRAISHDFLTLPTTVKAKIRFHDNVYKARIRLKGDLGDHWYSKTRMSLRVSLKGKQTILGFKKFSIQKPRARQHPYDQTFQSLLRQSGNLSAPHQYAHIYVNGKYWGVMDIEEHMSKELLEKQHTKDSIILRLGNDNAFELGHTKKIYDIGQYKLSDERLNVRIYGEKKSLRKPIHRQWLTYLSKSLLTPKETHYLDNNSFSRALIAATYWNNQHTLSPINSRYYFNPYTLRLEPITTDQGKFKKITIQEDHKSTLFDIAENIPFYRDIIQTKEFRENFTSNLNEVSKAFHNTQKELNYFHSFFPLDKAISGEAVTGNIQIVTEQNRSSPSSDILNPQHKHPKQKKISKESATLLPTHLHVKHYNSGKFEIYNLLPFPVTLSKILISELNILEKPIVIPPYIDYAPQTLTTDAKGLMDGEITIETEFMGVQRYSVVPATLIQGELHNPLLSATTPPPYLKQITKNNWLIMPGKWSVETPLVINGNLEISDNTQLQFSPEAYLIVKGSITAIGLDQYITLSAAHSTWKGLYVLEADKMSTLRKVKVDYTSALSHGLLALSGGVTFYKSDVQMTDVHFSHSQAEDTLNIVHSSFLLSNVTITDGISDGLDSDFSNGDIVNSRFSRIEGDAVDFSGSNVRINGLQTDHIHDKSISAGEASYITIKNSKLDTTGIGIASKDGSKVKCSDTTINHYQLYAAMTYVKKDFYGVPELTAQNCGPNTLGGYYRQKGSLMSINKLDITEQLLDVKKLYQSETMRK